MKYKIKSFYLTKEISEQVAGYAKETDRSESSVIRIAVKKFLGDKNEF